MNWKEYQLLISSIILAVALIILGILIYEGVTSIPVPVIS